MADGEQSAGAIFLEFKAQLESLDKGFASVNAKLDQMATKAQKSGKSFNDSGAAAADGFDRLDKASLQSIEKISRFTSRLIGLQIAMGALTNGTGGLGQLGQGLQSAGQGFQVFGALAGLAKDKMGLAAAGLIGITVALVTFVNEYIKAKIAATDASTTATDKAQASILAYSNALSDAGIENQVFGETLTDSVTKRLEIQKSAFDTAIKRLRQIPAEIKDLNDKIAREEDTKANIDRRNALGAEKSGLEGNVLRIGGSDALKSVLKGLGEDVPTFGKSAGTLFGDTAEAKIAKLIDDTQKLRDNLVDTETAAKLTFDAGFTQPGDEAAAKMALLEERLKTQQAVLKAIVDQQVAIDKVIDDPRLTEEQKKQLQDVRPGAGALGDQRALIDKTISDLKAAQAPQRFADTFATPFSQGIADGIVRGIQDGKSAVQTLAQVGENVFNTFLQKSADNFVKYMSQGLTAIAGVGGDVLGNLFNGLFGVAGFFLAGKGRGNGSSSFDSVKSAVTSTQQVRGIVAGDTSIPTAQISDNIGAAMEPVRKEVAEAVVVLEQILSAIRGTGGPATGGSGGARFVGAPTA